MTIIEAIVSVLVLFSAVMTLVTAIALWRAPDALTRANLLGPTTGVGIPLIIFAALLRSWEVDGFDANSLVRAVLAIVGMLVVASVSSLYMGRAIFGVTVADPRAEKGVKEFAPEHQPAEEAPGSAERPGETMPSDTRERTAGPGGPVARSEQ